MTKRISWTNPSVLALLDDASTDDPVAVIAAVTRQRVLDALDAGWEGPPFDPVDFARRQGISVIANDNVIDARTIPREDDGMMIEFNPNRPQARVRFSIAHEIAHTLFPDCRDQVRHRHSREDMAGDEWQLEMLCNVGAAEIVMPVGSIPEGGRDRPSTDLVVELRDKLAASAEALVIRLVGLTEFPCAAFSCSRLETSTPPTYRVDYFIPSRNWSKPQLRAGQILNEGLGPLLDCTAIGYTARGSVNWISEGDDTPVECIGAPPYPSNSFTRSVGFLFDEEPVEPRLQYVVGDATEPRGTGRKIIAHLVNDSARSWGGRGVAVAIKNKWPKVHDEFKEKVEVRSLKLGMTIPHQINDELWVVDMVAQQGYKSPKLKYGALQLCLDQLETFAGEISASVHMPRIGTGAAGGNWGVIEEQIESTLCDAGIRVTVYDFPGSTRQQSSRAQPSLFD